MSATSSKSTYLTYLIIVLLPFLLFYNIIPFLTELTIGSDYLLFPIRWQMELLFSMKTGSFPLYVPGFAYGHSSSALTLGQFFHPLSHISSVMPGYWDGKAIEWNNFIKFLSLGLTQLVLFAFLQKIRLSPLFSFVLSFITVYNVKLLELYRHGAPLEAYTGHLILCAVIGWYFIRPTKWIGPLCIMGVSYLLICSGHPEEMYYGIVGSGLFTCVAPFYLSSMSPDWKIDFKIALRFWIKVGLFLCIGILLSSAYILPYYFDFVSDNIQRVVQDYSFSVKDQDTFVGTLNNFFLPLRSLVREAFGGSSLILIAFVLPLLRFFRIKIPRSVWSIWSLVIIIFLHIQGSRTPIHRLVWEYMPFASSIRDPGRIAIILPFFIMLLLAWVVQAEAISLRLKQSLLTLRPVTILACLSMSLIIVYYLLYITAYYNLSSKNFYRFFLYPAGENSYIPYFWLELIIVMLGISLLICLAFYSMRTGTNRHLGLLLIILTLAQVGLVMKFRSAVWIENRYDTPTFKKMQKQKRTKLDYLYHQGGGLFPSIVTTHLKRTFMEPFLGKLYTHIIPVESRDEAYEKMERERLPHQLFIEEYNPEMANAITQGAIHMREGSINLIYSSYNSIRFQVVSEAPSMLSLSYPYTGKWYAWINGERVHVYRANGAAHAVEIPKGNSVVEFRYWSSAAFWGMMISCTTFALIGFFICSRTLKGFPSFIMIVVIASIGAGGFLLWYNSLYSGNNLKTEYTWSYIQPLKTPNLAYGKKNWLSYCTIFTSWAAREHELNRSRFVDGDRSPDSGFTTRLCDGPAWFLDLYRNEKIKTILLFERSHTTPVNIRPLTVAMSIDGNKWHTVASVVSPVNHNGPLNIVFDKPEIARFIKIEATGIGSLSFNEVEVYGP